MFRHRMNKKFGEIYREAKKPENQIPLDLKRDLFVLFSDHHKGDGSPADDFKKNAILYDFALSYYKKNGYKLIVLGDNEELWENHYDSILVNYKALIEKEIEMALDSPDNKKIRLWGNHDKEISLRKFRHSKHTQYKKVLKNVEYREGLCLGENIFLIHGHQGRFFDDIAWKISRWAVQFIWKTIQKIFNIGIDGPAENFKIRDNLEMEYYKWAKKNHTILICGHTHRAVFASSTHIDSLHSEIQQLKGLLDHISSDKKENIEKEIISRQRQIEKILMPRSGKTPKPFEEKSIRPVPCYFNDGCCGYTNGITCIEIEKGIIRLIKWQRQEKRRIIFGERNLQLLIEYIKKGLPLDEPLKPA